MSNKVFTWNIYNQLITGNLDVQSNINTLMKNYLLREIYIDIKTVSFVLYFAVKLIFKRNIVVFYIILTL
jgi:hypothetical protein